MSHRVTVRWAGKRQFVGWDQAGHGIVMDTTPDKSGEDTGTSPLQMVLYGLAGCTAFDIVGILEKKRQPLQGLEVLVEGWQREQGPPRPYDRINVEYVITGDVDPKAIEDAIRLSEDKYCSVKAVISDSVEMVSSWRFAGDGGGEQGE